MENGVLHKGIQPQEQSIKDEGSLDEDNYKIIFLLEKCCNSIYALLKKTLLLESAAGKVGCFRENERRPSALTDCEKSNCRSTSGADVIVPGSDFVFGE